MQESDRIIIAKYRQLWPRTSAKLTDQEVLKWIEAEKLPDDLQAIQKLMRIM
jgi:hypothetical protein